MARVCGECGASNVDIDRYCRNCGEPLGASIQPAMDETPDSVQGNRESWVAAMLVGTLLLCCLGVIGIALLDELLPAHPLRTLLMGTPTPTITFTPTATLAPTETPISTPTSTATPPLGEDSFEPDDTIAQAREIDTDGRHQSRTLSPPGDRDYVSFEASEAMEYWIETGNLGDECDTVLTLYDAAATELASDDDGADEPLASRIIWIADEDATLFVEVTHFDEEVGGTDTDYDLWVSEYDQITFEEDEYEPDDTMLQAREILLDRPQTHNIHVRGDHDWVSLRSEEGVTYRIETSNLGGGIDTIIYLYDEDGEELAQDDDGGEEDLASQIIWSADSTGILYVMIRDYWDDGAGPDMHYEISATETEPPEADAYEPDDSLEQARGIEVGLHQSHNLHMTGDHDWISFQATEGTMYVIETSRLGARIDTIIHLYDEDGQEITSDDDGADEPLASRIVYTADTDGSLYVMAQDLGDDAAGSGTEYTISVREQGIPGLVPDEYEPDDTMAEATEIEEGQIQSHNIHTEGDLDWFSFVAVEGTTYVIETSNLGQEADTVVFLYDQDGDELLQDDDGGEEPRASRITWPAEATGTFYVMVRDYKDDKAEREMGYDISIRQGAPEFGETRVYISAGAYHIIAYGANNFVVGVSERLSFENFALEADTAQVSGDEDNEYGLVYGYQDDANYYEAAISGDGYVGLFAKEQGAWHTIVGFRQHEAVAQGNAVNRLRLEVQDGSFSLYVNGQLAVQEFDSRFGEGLVGFGCGPLEGPALHCSFDNLSVWDQEGSLIWEDDFNDNSGNWFQTPVP